MAEPKRVERLRKNERSIYYYGDILHNKTKLELFQAETYLQEAEHFRGKTVFMHWEEYGIFIKRSEYAEWQKNHRDMPTPAQISRRCGGFNKAKELAGVVPSRVLGRTIDDEEIYKALYDCSKDLGKTKFSEAEYLEWRQKQKTERPHIETIRVRLGGFLPEAKKKLDLDTYYAGPQEKYNKTNWLPAVIRFIEDALKLENYEKWRQENDGPSLSVLRRFSGGYNDAVKKALIKYIEKK